MTVVNSIAPSAARFVLSLISCFSHPSGECCARANFTQRFTRPFEGHAPCPVKRPHRDIFQRGRLMKVFLSLVVLLALALAPAQAQTRDGRTVEELVAKLRDKDQKVASDAVDALE